MPISFPDGVMCKPPELRRYPPLAPPLGYFGRGTLPAHPGVSPADAEMLDVWRRIRQHPASLACSIPVAQRATDVVRYSDRYTAATAPNASFAKSPYCRLRSGVHYPAELNPSGAKAKSTKRSRSSAGETLQGASWAADDELEVLEAAAQAEDAERDGSGSEAEGEDGERRRKRGGRFDDAEPPEEGAEGEEADDDDDDYPEEEEEGDDILGDEGGFAFDTGFEDGMDDADSGGEEEPTY